MTVSHLLEYLVKDKNVTDEQYIIWTDFERINLTHFRTSIFCRQLLKLRAWTAWRLWPQFNLTFKTLKIRSISSVRFPLVTRNTHEFHNFYYASSKFEIEAKKHFYDTVLAHGDGTIINRQTPKHISLGIFSNSLKIISILLLCYSKFNWYAVYCIHKMLNLKISRLF